MSDPVAFLHAFGHAMTTLSLYPDGHPSRERAVDDTCRELEGLYRLSARPTFTFLDDEVVFGRERLRELKSWEWGARLTQAGVQRIEVERPITPDELREVLLELHARLQPSGVRTCESRQMRPLGVKFGLVDVDVKDAIELSTQMTTLELALGEEAESFRWLQRHVQAGGSVPRMEVEAVVRSLAVAMHGDRRLVLPLLQLKEFDQYTTTHSLNVSVLAMGLAEKVGCSPDDVRAHGVAGLLHDIGKVHIPIEVLTKPGRLSPEEQALMRTHPAEGAKLLMKSHDDLDLAAIVAYEHHIMLDGGGYPTLHYHRECALASRLVHVCDVYDALCTNRPYRAAWTSEQAVELIKERAGTEFDPELVRAFTTMIEEGFADVRVLASDRDALTDSEPTGLDTPPQPATPAGVESSASLDSDLILEFE